MTFEENLAQRFYEGIQKEKYEGNETFFNNIRTAMGQEKEYGAEEVIRLIKDKIEHQKSREPLE